MANDIHDRQQLPQRHGELGGHPALCADLASLLLYIIWLWCRSCRHLDIFQLFQRCCFSLQTLAHTSCALASLASLKCKLLQWQHMTQSSQSQASEYICCYPLYTSLSLSVPRYMASVGIDDKILHYTRLEPLLLHSHLTVELSIDVERLAPLAPHTWMPTIYVQYAMCSRLKLAEHAQSTSKI